MGKWIDAIKKLDAEIAAQKNIPKSAGVDESTNTTSQTVLVTNTDKVHEDKKIDASNVDNKAADEKANREKKSQSRKIDIPPNCYVDGKITAHFGVFTYREIFHYTSQPLEIKSGLRRRIPCSKCYVKQQLDRGEIKGDYKRLVCANCGLSSTYFGWCRTNAIDIRGSLLKNGLINFVYNHIGLGYDTEKEMLIFPLNHNQYLELGYSAGKYTQSREQSLKILMHYNRCLAKEENGKFKPTYNYNYSGMQLCPYLDNRFYSTNGQVVIAGCAVYEDDGKAEIASGRLILPFPI